MPKLTAVTGLEEVRAMKPIDRLAHWIKEREKARRAKKAEEPKPWTTDEVIQQYRFCNVRRMDDKVSQWLMENWYVPFFNHKNIVIAACIARFFNKPESLDMITPWVFDSPKGKPWSWPEIKEAVCTVMRTAREEGMTIFNGAYMVRGNDGIDKVSSVMDHYVESVVAKKLHLNLETSSMEYAWADLKECYGWGSFMAGQVVADLRWAMKGAWVDKFEWAPIGPGSKRGMNILHDRPLEHPLPQEQFGKELTELMSKLKKILPEAITARLEAIDYQNCLCEISGYEKVLWQRGRKKQLYPGK